jgi:hypothetical protein
MFRFLDGGGQFLLTFKIDPYPYPYTHAYILVGEALPDTLGIRRVSDFEFFGF